MIFIKMDKQVTGGHHDTENFINFEKNEDCEAFL